MKYYVYIFALSLLPQLLRAQIVVQTSGTNVGCFGDNNGAALASAMGGTLPYSFAWSNGGINNTITSLSAGTYTVTVTDNVGSSATKSIVITQPPLLGATLNGQPQICIVAPDGFSYAIPTGGTPPYSYAWSNNVQAQLNNHLTAANYAVTVTDTRGCSTVKSFTVGFLGLGLYLLPHSEAATCPQPNNGSASITALSGNGPYLYQWNTGASTAAINNLTAGNYVVTVSDVNGCSATNSVTIAQENVDTISIVVPDPQCTNQIYEYTSTDGYHVYNWMVNDPRDSIVGGNFTREVQVKWGVQGQKELSVVMMDTLTGCTTGMSFGVTVYICSSSTQAVLLEKFQVSPNPFDQFISIHSTGEDLKNAEVQIFNSCGVMLARQQFAGDATALDTKTLAPGLYFIRLTSGTEIRTWKMVKG